MALILFYVLAALTLAFALGVVRARMPLFSVLSLLGSFFCLSGIYLLLGFPFLAATQLLVFAGAVMVLFLFVIMLLNLGHPSELADARGKWGYVLALFVGLVMLAEVMALTRDNTVDRMIPPGLAATAAAPTTGGIIGPIAAPLFTEYLFAFELTSVLLLAAIVGAVVLGKRRTDAR